MRASSRSPASDRWRTGSTPSPLIRHTSGLGARQRLEGGPDLRVPAEDRRLEIVARPSGRCLPSGESASRSSATAPRRPADCRAASTQPIRLRRRDRIGGVTSSTGAAGRAGSRSRRSPRPQPSASGAPLRKNGTSLPSRAANWSSSCRGTASPASRLTASRAAAASLEPPPRPAWTGIRLVEGEVHAEPVAGGVEHQRRGRAPRDSCSGGPTSAPSTSIVTPSSLAPLRLQRVRQVHQAEQRLHAVIAVGLPREHPQEEVDLGVGGDARPRGGHARMPRRSLRATGVRASDQAPSRMIGRKVVTWKAIA